MGKGKKKKKRSKSSCRGKKGKGGARKRKKEKRRAISLSLHARGERNSPVFCFYEKGKRKKRNSEKSIGERVGQVREETGKKKRYSNVPTRSREKRDAISDSPSARKEKRKKQR